MLIASFLFGYWTIRICYKGTENSLFSFDVFIISGLMVLSVYAEFFSLFYKVGAMACFILFILGIGLTGALCIKDRAQIGQLIKMASKKSYLQYILVAFCIIGTVAWTVLTPQHYDTALYHAQSVRWIEEYGVVPGLGNLHNRFAYNSAFMPLQALFSLNWLIDKSLHTLNGFICCVALIYALVTNNFVMGKRLQLSDFFKFAMIVYIYINREFISSLSSDILAMLLTIYILAKWSELNERKTEDGLPYAFLCMLSIWAVTVKLSTAAVVLLAIYPIVLLIKGKEWKKIMTHIGAGFFIVMPWLIRNVIISGYLVYPYSKLDIFNVDWKMLPSVLDYDKIEIAVWGRNVKDVNLYQQPVREWIETWYKGQGAFEQGLIIIGMICAVIALGMCIYSIYKRNYMDLMIGMVSLAGLILWFFSAPLLRYGSAFLMLPICIVLNKIFPRNNKPVLILGLLILLPIGSIYLSGIDNLRHSRFWKQKDYEDYSVREVPLNGISILIPEEGDQAGYWAFPSTPHAELLNVIELRGEEMKDGFRVKPQYQGKIMKSDGFEWVQ